MLIGVACTVESRFSAVTTISSRSPLCAGATSPAADGAGPAGPAGSGPANAGVNIHPAQTRATIEAVRDSGAARAMRDAFFILVSLKSNKVAARF